MYQAVDTQEPVDEVDESVLKPRRDRGPSRCYNVMMIVVYFAMLIMAVVALGTFGVTEARINHRTRVLGNSSARSCILFSDFAYTDTEGVVHIYLNSSGLCGYVLWGLISVTIVVFIWLIYSIVQAVIGPAV